MQFLFPRLGGGYLVCCVAWAGTPSQGGGGGELPHHSGKYPFSGDGGLCSGATPANSQPSVWGPHPTTVRDPFEDSVTPCTTSFGFSAFCLRKPMHFSTTPRAQLEKNATTKSCVTRWGGLGPKEQHCFPSGSFNQVCTRVNVQGCCVYKGELF